MNQKEMANYVNRRVQILNGTEDRDDIYYFIDKCNEFKVTFANDANILALCLSETLTKLRGKAYDATRHTNIAEFDILTSIIKKKFLPTRTIENIASSIRYARQGKYEKVQDFGDRIRILAEEYKNGYNMEYKVAIPDKFLSSEPRNGFTSGLANEQMRTALIMNGEKNFDKLVTMATELESNL